MGTFRRRSLFEVLRVFLQLGCTSFGGPIAHLGYFRKELVERRAWCTEETFAEIVALAQSLPGPASSQTGFALGIIRAGWLGGLAASIGFTLPSAAIMLAFAYGHSWLRGIAGAGLLHGLQLAAVAVVAQAVLSMQRSLAPDRIRLAIAIAATGFTLFLPAALSTVVPIAAGGCAGLILFRRMNDQNDLQSEKAELRLSTTLGVASACGFLLFLFALPVGASLLASPGLTVFSAFYRSGALVFGGGHVVLPLLEDAVVAKGWVTQPVFLAGYGAAQALPGPLFSFAAYLGASVRPTPSPILFGLLGLIGIFTPGLLAMMAVLPHWNAIRGNRHMQRALRGINASVVGLLIAALFHPLWTTTIRSRTDFWLALFAFTMLAGWNVKPWVVVAGVAMISTVLALL
jgi:chromate transporter